MRFGFSSSTVARTLGCAAIAALAWAAQAQPSEPTASDLPKSPISYAQLGTPIPSTASPLVEAMQAARSGDVNRARRLQADMPDALDRKLVDWAMIDASGSMMAFDDIDRAARTMSDWPRATRRRAAVERNLEAAGLAPETVIAWFGGREPETPQGAMALATAYQTSGHQDLARTLIRRVWRERAFEADVQARMQSRFGAWFSADDNAQRLENLLYTTSTTAAQALLASVDAEHQALAAARLALRNNRDDASLSVSRVPAALADDPGLVFDRARYYRRRNLDVVAVGLMKTLPSTSPSAEAAAATWAERRALVMAALRSGDTRGAYTAADAHGLVDGVDYLEAEFLAGWIALTKLGDTAAADRHFANVQKAGATPVSLSRALYWRGRTAETRGDTGAAQVYWRAGAAYYTAFYGLMSAERAGVSRVNLGLDPTPSNTDRERFEARETVKAARRLGASGLRDPFRSFVMTVAESLDSVEEAALVVDLARQYGDNEIALRAAREAATRGFYLLERGYPLLSAPTGGGLSEPAFTLAIVRQESAFDPTIRSTAGARGLMQLMPTTAAILARRQGVAYSPSRLNDGDYNMRLGSAYLAQLTSEFDGSYVLAAAGYNAGPGRAAQWAVACGDPRQSTIDPADFIECIPFSETRNYVMRVMEGLEMYRARMAGGTAPLTLSADLRRGGWTPITALAPTRQAIAR